jgi:hypothetical protein
MIDANEEHKVRWVENHERYTRPRKNSSLTHIEEDGKAAGFVNKGKAPSRQRAQSDNLQRLQRNISYGRERADNDLTVMFLYPPYMAQRPVDELPQQTRPDVPLAPRTKEWDEFMDFDSTNSLNLYGVPEEWPFHTVDDTPLSRRTVIRENDQAIPSSAQEILSPQPRLRGGSADLSLLTWNLCLNQILRNEHLDQNLKKAMRERIQSSTTTNGDGSGEPFFVSTAEAGVVPNFSYLIPGSAFYTRVAAKQLPQESASSKARHHEENQQQFDFGFDRTPVITEDLSPRQNTPEIHHSDDVPRSRFSSTSSLTLETIDSGPRRAPPSLHDDLPDRVQTLLESLLTPSELYLCSDVISTTASTNPNFLHSPKLSASSTNDDGSVQSQTHASSTKFQRTDTHSRLILNLHLIVTGLQDRIVHLEDTLIPVLGKALKKKSYTIDVLYAEARNLGDDVEELRTAVDFGNKILAGCWVREYEVWRTLANIRRKREAKGKGLFARLTDRWKREKTGDGVLSPAGSAGESLASRKALALSRRELDAMILMAEQNVQILREDIADMVEKVEACRNATFKAFPVVEAEEGSWRDA